MLQTASAVGLLRTILIILLVYYGIKILARLFAPMLFGYVAKKTEQRFGEQFKGYKDQQSTPKKEGEVSIDKMPKSKSTNKDVGEYVDYEEID